MRKLVLAAVLVLMASGAQASSYLDIFGVVHSPILTNSGEVHSYSGNNLEPYGGIWVSPDGMNFFVGDLTDASLPNADLRWALLYWTLLTGADLTGADLSFAEIGGTRLTNALLFSVNLTGAAGWESSATTWTGAKYSLNARDNFGNPIPDTSFPTGMDQAWRDAAGMIAIPEPSTALLLGLGLAGISARRRV